MKKPERKDDSTITSLFLDFLQISYLRLHKTMSEKLEYQKLCLSFVPKMFQEQHKIQGSVTGLIDTIK